MDEYMTVAGLRDRDIPKSAQTLAKAFGQDPLFRYVVSGDVDRLVKLESLFRALLKYSLEFRETYTTSRQEGVICWVPPGSRPERPKGILTSGMLRLPGVLGWAAIRRLIDHLFFSNAIHRRAVQGLHWYLWLLGVDPAYQGCGIGSSLLAPVLARADESQTPCYLETLNQRNVPFYQRHGFTVAEREIAPKSGLRVWGMVRR